MAKRRKAVAEQTDLMVLNARIDMLQQQLNALKQPGPSSVQAGDFENALDPVPWETMVNWPGVHTPASPADPFVYYHPGDTAIGGATTPGFKTLRTEKTIPWIRKTKGYGAALVVAGTFLDDEETLFAGAGQVASAIEGSSDYSTYFDVPSQYLIRAKIHGKVEIYVEVKWTTSFEGPAWFYLHDGVGSPTAVPGHSRPTGYGQLGSTTAGFWAVRTEAAKTFQIDVAQLSGSTKTVDAYYMEMHYVGDYDGPEREDSIYFDQ